MGLGPFCVDTMTSGEWDGFNYSGSSVLGSWSPCCSLQPPACPQHLPLSTDTNTETDLLTERGSQGGWLWPSKEHRRKGVWQAREAFLPWRGTAARAPGRPALCLGRPRQLRACLWASSCRPSRVKSHTLSPTWVPASSSNSKNDNDLAGIVQGSKKSFM